MAIKDFDAFLKEREKQPIPFKIYGKTWHLSSTMPALIMVKAVRAKKEGLEEIGEEIVLEMCEALFGKEQFDELLKLGLDLETMEEIITWATEVYTEKLGKQEARAENANFLAKKSRGT